jgi:hypothetical protein
MTSTESVCWEWTSFRHNENARGSDGRGGHHEEIVIEDFDNENAKAKYGKISGAR